MLIMEVMGATRISPEARVTTSSIGLCRSSREVLADIRMPIKGIKDFEASGLNLVMDDE